MMAETDQTNVRLVIKRTFAWRSDGRSLGDQTDARLVIRRTLAWRSDGFRAYTQMMTGETWSNNENQSDDEQKNNKRG